MPWRSTSTGRFSRLQRCIIDFVEVNVNGSPSPGSWARTMTALVLVIGMFWRTRAYFGGHQPVLTGNGVFGRRARSNPPLSAQTRQFGNSGKSLAGNGVQSTISRHCPPIPASLGTQAKIEEQIWLALAGSRLVPPL